jgi:hypothetical protein
MSKLRVSLTVKQDDLDRASFEFFHFFGQAMAAWSTIEQSLFYWFVLLTGMQEEMARGIFYGARGFGARADMLEAAIQTVTNRTPEEVAFIKEAAKKARMYSSFRNKIAHGDPRLNVTKKGELDVADLAEAVHFTIVQGSASPNEPIMSITDMNVAAANFRALRREVISALPSMKHLSGAKPPAECLALVLALPNQPNDKNDPTPAEPAPPPARPEGSRLRRGPELRDRIPLGRQSTT